MPAPAVNRLAYSDEAGRCRRGAVHRRTRGPDHASGQAVLLTKQTKVSKLDLVRYYLSVAPGALAGNPRPADRAQALRERRGGRGVLPEARARPTLPEWLRTVTLSFPSGRTARRGRGGRCGGAGVDRQPRLHRAASASGAVGRPRPSRRAARRSRSRARASSWADVRTVAMEVKALLGGGRAARLAEDQRLARDARECAHRAAVDLHGGAAGGGRAVAGGRAAGARARQFEVVEGGAPRRVPRLQPERQGPDDVLGLFGAAAARRAGLDAACAGARSRTAIRRTSPSSRSRSASPRSAIRTRRWTRRRGRWRGCWNWPTGTRRRGLGDAPWPPHFRKMEGEAPRVAPSRARPSAKDAADEDAADRGRELSGQRCGLGRLGAVEGASIPKRPGCWQWMMCWWIPCEDGRLRGRASGSTCGTCRKHCGRRRKRPIRMTILPASGAPCAAGRRSDIVSLPQRPLAKIAVELLRRNHLQLGIGAIAPAACRSATCGTGPCGGNGRPACGRTRLPLPARDAAAPKRDPCPGSSGSARPACAGLASRPRPCIGPFLPGWFASAFSRYGVRNSTSSRRFFVGEAGADTHVLQRAGIVEQTEQQRADGRRVRPSCASGIRPPRSRTRARASP